MIITHLQNDLQDSTTDLLLYENKQSEFVLTIRRPENNQSENDYSEIDFVFESSQEVSCLLERLKEAKEKLHEKENLDRVGF